MTGTTYTVDLQFAGKDAHLREIYDQLLVAVRTFGPFVEEPKKTSIHLVNKSGFAGVHTRKSSLILNIRTDYPIEGPRVAKSEQVSKRRYHNEIKLERVSDIDEQLLSWLHDAYNLSS